MKYPVTFIYTCQRSKKPVRHVCADAWDMGWFEQDIRHYDPTYRIVDRTGAQQWPEQSA
jgi:hypothetical protein